jgi:predicted RNA-binding Zn ribbon-like protein
MVLTEVATRYRYGAMRTSYPGPVRDEPLAIELHNTVYATRGAIVDGLATAEGLADWLAAVADRLPVRAQEVDASRRPEFLALRDAAHDALHAGLSGKPVPDAALETVNDTAARAPLSPRAAVRADGRLSGEMRYHTDDATDVALATIAADAIEVLTGPDREQLRACGAPGCVLIFQKDHPRRTWCSEACGNRARQARHYERARRAQVAAAPLRDN